MLGRLGWVALALASPLLSFVSCAPRGASEAGSAPAASASGGPVLVPVTAPAIQAIAADGGARATLVSVWASWCAPCREEFPALLKVARERGPEGLRLVLVSADFDDQLEAARRFLLTHGVTDTTFLMSGDQQSFIDTMNPRWSGALPATFVYDGAGRLVEFWEGMANEAEFREAADAALHPHAATEDSTS